MSRCLRICGAYSYRLSRRHSTVLLIVSFILTLTIILQLYSYRHHHPHIMTRPGDLEYKPGAFLKGHHPNENRSYCRFHYGLPNRFNLDNVTVHNSPEQGRRSQYRVIYNAITGITYANATKFNAVTYATQATPEFLYHIIEIARFWEGPISLAVYVPDFDLEVAMKIMNHLCRCYYGMSKVSMHLFFPSRYPPKLMIKDDLLRSISTTTLKPTTEINFEALLERKRSYKNLSSDARAKYIQAVREKNLKRKMARTQVVRGKMPVLEFKDCTGPSFLNVSTFRSQENLFYPVNIGRNVARNASRTNYFLVSDIELVPSEGLAPKFLTMVRKLMGDKKREEGCIFAKTVFVVPLFEVERGEEIPRDKETLVNLVAANRAVYFHQLVCTHCQRFPGLQTWLSRPSPRGVEPMVIGRREYPYHRWEPLYFGTQKEPWYSELLTWEGKQDKMTQMLELCLQEYRLVVLDGGFLSHAAIRLKKEEKKWERAERNNHKRYNEIVVRLKKKYKDIPQCKVI